MSAAASQAAAEHYFSRVERARFMPTEHVGGGWNPREQHVAPLFGLLVHLVEVDHSARRTGRLALSRMSFDILGTIQMEEFEVELRVVRPGKTIELVEASVLQDNRVAVTLRAWFMQAQDTSSLSGGGFARIPDVGSFPSFSLADTWPGGFVRSVVACRQEQTPGRAVFWLRTPVALLAGESTSRTASSVALMDIANGVTPRSPPDEVAFPNLDLTIHLLREPSGDWTGFDATVSFGAVGVGITHAVLHDENGPLGTLVQTLTVRPKSSRLGLGGLG